MGDANVQILQNSVNRNNNPNSEQQSSFIKNRKYLLLECTIVFLHKY